MKVIKISEKQAREMICIFCNIHKVSASSCKGFVCNGISSSFCWRFERVIPKLEARGYIEL